LGNLNESAWIEGKIVAEELLFLRNFIVVFAFDDVSCLWEKMEQNTNSLQNWSLNENSFF